MKSLNSDAVKKFRLINCLLETMQCVISFENAKCGQTVHNRKTQFETQTVVITVTVVLSKASN